MTTSKCSYCGQEHSIYSAFAGLFEKDSTVCIYSLNKMNLPIVEEKQLDFAIETYNELKVMKPEKPVRSFQFYDEAWFEKYGNQTPVPKSNNYTPKFLTFY